MIELHFTRFFEVSDVGQARQVGKVAANGPSNTPSIGRPTHEQPPLLPHLRKGDEDIIAQAQRTRLDLR